MSINAWHWHNLPVCLFKISHLVWCSCLMHYSHYLTELITGFVFPSFVICGVCSGTFPFSLTVSRYQQHRPRWWWWWWWWWCRTLVRCRNSDNCKGEKWKQAVTLAICGALMLLQQQQQELQKNRLCSLILCSPFSSVTLLLSLSFSFCLPFLLPREQHQFSGQSPPPLTAVDISSSNSSNRGNSSHCEQYRAACAYRNRNRNRDRKEERQRQKVRLCDTVGSVNGGLLLMVVDSLHTVGVSVVEQVVYILAVFFSTFLALGCGHLNQTDRHIS